MIQPQQFAVIRTVQGTAVPPVTKLDSTVLFRAGWILLRFSFSRRGNEKGEESRCKSKLPFFLETFNLKNGMVGTCEVFFHA